MRIARLLPLLFVPSLAVAQQPRAGDSLVPFRTEAELARYLRAVSPPVAGGASPVPAAPCAAPAPTIHSGTIATTAARAAVVTGVVRNTAGQALQGASIVVGTPGRGTMTRDDGRFTLGVPDTVIAGSGTTGALVQFRRIGYDRRTLTRAVRSGDSVHVDIRLCESTATLDNVVVTAAASVATAGESITNTQHEGVDEGGIVKLHGNHLVILRRGRLFTVALGDRAMRPVAEVDAFPPGVDGRGAWYDELLVHGDRVVVIGYSYVSAGTELNVFRIDDEGGLRYSATYHLRSNDYYSSRNYASRLVDGKLVFYTPLFLGRGGDPLASLPALRRWRGRADSAARFERIVTPRRVYTTPRSTSGPAFTALHTVTTCDLEADGADEMECDATVVVGPPGRVFYVSPTAVYIWTSDWRRAAGGEAHAVVYRMPLDGSAPGAVRAAGSPVDQFSFLEQGANLHVVVEPSGGGEWMWSSERGRSSLALARIPLRSFGDGRESVPRSAYRRLPVPERGTVQNRFVNGRLLYGMVRWEGTDSGSVAVVPLDGGAITELPLPHDVGRIEVMGPDALVGGASHDGLHLTTIRLRGTPRVGHAYRLAGAAEGEERSHGFFYKPDGPLQGTIGLPIRSAEDGSFASLREESASVLYVRNEGDAFTEMGQLVAGARLLDDGCLASCADWYGNSRPLFIGGRIFALLGYELVEGAVRGGRLVETGRVQFAKERASAERMRQAQDSIALRRLVEHEARWRESGNADSVLQHYSPAVLVMAPGRQLRYWNALMDLKAAKRPDSIRIVPIVEEITVDGATAIMRVSWLTRTGTGEATARTSMREMRVWRRDGEGRWWFIRGMQEAPVTVERGQ